MPNLYLANENIFNDLFSSKLCSVCVDRSQNSNNTSRPKIIYATRLTIVTLDDIIGQHFMHIHVHQTARSSRMIVDHRISGLAYGERQRRKRRCKEKKKKKNVVLTCDLAVGNHFRACTSMNLSETNPMIAPIKDRTIIRCSFHIPATHFPKILAMSCNHAASQWSFCTPAFFLSRENNQQEKKKKI